MKLVHAFPIWDPPASTPNPFVQHPHLLASEMQKSADLTSPRLWIQYLARSTLQHLQANNDISPQLVGLVYIYSLEGLDYLPGS
jgi:hypothetical protein